MAATTNAPYSVDVARADYTHAELEAAFDAVKSRDHWKGPVFGRIEPSEVEVTAAAVVYFTATEATFEAQPSGRVLVNAPGYWAGPAN